MNPSNSEGVMPSELRWLLSKRDRSEPNYDLLLKCLATMDANMVRMHELRKQLDYVLNEWEAADGITETTTRVRNEVGR